LVVSATAWWVDDIEAGDLYARLAPCVAVEPGKSRIAIADSKALYKPRGGLQLLERALLPAIELIGKAATDWDSLWSALGADPENRRDELPWCRGYTRTLPVDLDAAEASQLAASLRQALDPSGVRLVEIRSRAVFPAEFNALVDGLGNKATALSTVTLSLLAELLAGFEPAAVQVVCDKHGGRNRYQEYLQRAFPEWLVEVHGESRTESLYRLGPPEARCQIAFRTGGEAYLPAALASMASKYLRELSMEALNAFWRARLPDLRPTAGYPVDARRFKAEISDLQRELAIDDRVLWRSR
jgi:hypothetical protein